VFVNFITSQLDPPVTYETSTVVAMTTPAT